MKLSTLFAEVYSHFESSHAAHIQEAAAVFRCVAELRGALEEYRKVTIPTVEMAEPAHLESTIELCTTPESTIELSTEIESTIELSTEIESTIELSTEIESTTELSAEIVVESKLPAVNCCI